jgi:hypothetical protein
MRTTTTLLAFVFLGCESSTAPLPTGAQRFVPPDVYRQWWALTEACSGLRGDLAAITWYDVPGAESIPAAHGQTQQGEWRSSGNRIVLAGNARLEGDLVRHEMLHALLRLGAHPRQSFVGRCGNVVVCTGRCLAEAGPAPPPDPAAVLVDPAALDVHVELDPAQPGVRVNGGHFIMWVVARNPSDQPVRVVLPPSGDSGPSVSFSYRLGGDRGTTEYDFRAEAPEVTRFAPREAKRFAFDFVVAGGGTRYDIAPGTYLFAGTYGGVWAADAPVATVAP